MQMLSVTSEGLGGDAKIGYNDHHQTVSVSPVIPPSQTPKTPSLYPSNTPSTQPTRHPTPKPSPSPTRNPTPSPTPRPTPSPTPRPSPSPTPRPTPSPSAEAGLGPLLFAPGDFSKNKLSTDRRVRLSNGLSAKPIARSGQFVNYANGGRSATRFHIDPDGAAVIAKSNNSGWYYVSNAEEPAAGTNWNNGGVGSIEFDRNGRVIRYRRVANRLRNNCGGGKTPWNSWITCEEIGGGKVHQVDPAGAKGRTRTAMGNFGSYESFAYDDGTRTPTFYVTRDADNGVLTRFTPDATGMACYNQRNEYDRWCTLDHGGLDYLLISGGSSGTFQWTRNLNAAKANARRYYPFSEGIDIADGVLYFVSKHLKRLLILNLRTMRYTYHSTRSGAFNHQPDQVARLVDDDESILYFCEDGGRDPGVHGRNHRGRFFTILYGSFSGAEETTGLAFSPDGLRMYVSFQNIGIIYEVTRDDGRPFQGELLDIKYHAT